MDICETEMVPYTQNGIKIERGNGLYFIYSFHEWNFIPMLALAK